MWRLNEIKIRNIVSFREAQFEVAQGVATMIFGKNEDNSSQPCNGSGKSSFIEAISLALTGEQLRKVKSIDEIINDFEDEAYVYLRLSNDYDGSVFTIERTVSRGFPQVVRCHKYNRNGDEIETDKTTQPTVADYNRMILDEIGLSKSDIYNTYILCDNKYESFFDCSDKNKKEIINRFSNGVLIDQSIERLQADMIPIQADYDALASQTLKIKGSISAIETELTQAEEKKRNALTERENRLARLDEQIAKCREDIGISENKRTEGCERLEQLKEAQRKVAEMEESDISVMEAYAKVKSICSEYRLDSVSDFVAMSDDYKTRLSRLEDEIEIVKKEIDKANSVLADCRSEHKAAESQYLQLSESVKKQNKEDDGLKERLQKEISNLDDQLDKIESQLKSNKRLQTELELKISKGKAMMEGAVECPRCNHRFLLESDMDYEQIGNDIKQFTIALDSNKSEERDLNIKFDDIDGRAADLSDNIKNIDKQKKDRATSLDESYLLVGKLNREISRAESNVTERMKRLSDIEREQDRINGKIEILRNRLFGEISGILDGRIQNGKLFIEQQDSNIEFHKGRLSQYRDSKRELIKTPDIDFAASLRQSLKEYKAELSEVQRESMGVKGSLDKLKEQEAHFTMFKSHIARKKIDALSLVVNDFLEKIGSDIRLRLEGFSMTKTGKLRDKISVQVMRDGIDCGSFQKFSGGEKARLNLACILSLHTLTNSNCEDGKGLDFIIIDELLDKSDEVGMAAYCDALNKLGQTSLLITQGAVSESYPYKLLIVKRQGVSTIQN